MAKGEYVLFNPNQLSIMKRNLLLSFVFTLICAALAQAQVTGTYIVTDNPPRMASCDDTLITLADIYNQTGLHDLNDPLDNVSMYRILELNGSVITGNVISAPFHYSDYDQVYVEKTGTPFNGHNGTVISINIITPPTFLFDTDTLKFVVERGVKINYAQDFFNHFDLFSSGKDILPLGDRILFTDMAVGTEESATQNP